jgi:iron(III) transport system substrate-binding protein
VSPPSTRRVRRLGLGACVVALTGFLGACGGGSSSASGTTPGGKAVTITVYNGQHQQTTEALIAAFEHQTGIQVKERDGDENELAAEIRQEGSRSPADVFFTENSPALMSLQEKGLLASVPASVLSQVPGQYSSPAGNWVGVSARVSVLVYNTSALQPSQLPSSVMDLADPKWKGKLALAPTETDFQPIVTSIALAHGQQAALQWLKSVAGNASNHDDPDNETVTADVNKGQAAIGLINHYYWFRLQQQLGGPGHMHSQVAYFAPRDPGYVIDVSGAAVLASSRHQAAADQFLAFLVAAQGQETIVKSDSFEYPLRPGVAAPAGLRPFDQLQPAPVTIADLGDGSEALKLIQQAQLV